MTLFSSDLEKRLKTIQKIHSDKRIELSRAIEKTLRAQMKLHFACISALPYSSVREIIRQSVDKDLKFEVMSLGSASQIQIAHEIIVLLPLRAGMFPVKVPYITVPQTNVSVCVNTEGVFEKIDSETFILTGYMGKASEQVQKVEKSKK